MKKSNMIKRNKVKADINTILELGEDNSNEKDIIERKHYLRKNIKVE